MEAEEGIRNAQADIDHSVDQQEYLENQSRRNNVKVFGIPEKDAEEVLESWEESEQLVKNETKNKLKVEVDVNIKRAHRVENYALSLPTAMMGQRLRLDPGLLSYGSSHERTRRW